MIVARSPRKRRGVITSLAVLISVLLAGAVTLLVVAKQNENANVLQRQAEDAPPSAVASLTTTTSTSTAASSSSMLRPTENSTSRTSSSPTVTTTSTVVSAIQGVPQSPPTHLSIQTSVGVTIDAKVGGVDYNDDIAAPSCSTSPDPECPNKAYWIQNRMGTAPGSSTDNSTYIVGHSWTEQPRVFDSLSNYAMTHPDTDANGQPVTALMESEPNLDGSPRADVETWPVSSLVGSTVVLTTPEGVLTYGVTKAYLVRKEDVGRTHEFRVGTPNQVVIDTCGIDLSSGVDKHYAVVLFGGLVAAAPS